MSWIFNAFLRTFYILEMQLLLWCTLMCPGFTFLELPFSLVLVPGLFWSFYLRLISAHCRPKTNIDDICSFNDLLFFAPFIDGHKMVLCLLSSFRCHSCAFLLKRMELRLRMKSSTDTKFSSVCGQLTNVKLNSSPSFSVN